MTLKEAKKISDTNILLGMCAEVTFNNEELTLTGYERNDFYIPIGHSVDECKLHEDLQESDWHKLLTPLSPKVGKYWVLILLTQHRDCDDDSSFKYYTIEEIELSPLFHEDIDISDIVISDKHEFPL